MKRTLALLLTCALGFGLLAGCSGKSDPTYGPGDSSFTPPPLEYDGYSHVLYPVASSPKVEGALAAFGLELLKQARAANAEKAMASEWDHVPFSTFISPLSVAMVLSMAANGADGETLTQFLEVLGGGADLEELNAAWAQLLLDYRAPGGSTQFNIANSLWKDLNGGITADFIGICRGGYGAQLYSADLSDLRIVDDLNGWVSEHTNKMIPEIISEPFDKDTELLLVNALYLKNKWLREFDPRSTREMDFHHAGGPDSHPDYLQHFNTTLSYIQGEGAQGTVLPYDDGRLAFFVLLPDLYPDSPDLGEWLNGLDAEELSRLINSREDTLFLRFAMPKFKAEWQGDLENILPELGLRDAFVPGTADFSKMGDNEYGYYIDKVIHAAKIEVNEKGTEAAAATVVAAPAGAAEPPQEGITLILDRPFLYGIIDLQTSVLLFLGTYE